MTTVVNYKKGQIAYENELKSSKQYKTLATGQGLTTRFFGLTTDSVKAFNKIIDEVKSELHLVSPKRSSPSTRQ